ncbi:nucleotide exchange factor GrpE [Candidatus Parcubacteria bacterium]|nr:nucleotide exchange factor GrpE [Candidatus Parcubacteria bacterium]
MAEEDDIVFDSSHADLDDSVVAEENQLEAIKKLRARVKEAEKAAKEVRESHERAQADFINARRRDEADRAHFMKYAVEGLVEDLVPVLDSFDMALTHGHKDILPIYNQFIKVLREHGLEEFDPKGEKFDPSRHEAIGSTPTENKNDDHKVLEVLSKGYILSGKIIRPAKVRIGEFINSN